MAKNVKCVFVFRDGSGTGWTELHYWASSSDTPELNTRVTHMVNVVAPARADLLSGDCALIGVRASYPRNNSYASLSKKVFLVGNAALSGVSPAISIAAKFTDTTVTRHKVTHLRGFWDVVESNGEYHPEGGAAENWTEKFNDWKGTLIAGQYGWLSRSAATSTKGPVSNYLVGVDGRVTFTIAPDAVGALVAGQIATVRFSRLNSGSCTLNRSLLVEVIDGTHLKTVDQVAAGPFTGQGRFNYRATEFAQYASLYDASLGRRPQGRPFDQLPGRGRKVAKY